MTSSPYNSNISLSEIEAEATKAGIDPGDAAEQLLYEADPGNQDAVFNRTDAGNAEYFTNLNSNRLRYDHKRKRWLEWVNHYWREDTDGQVMRLALKAVRHRYNKATRIDDPKERENEACHAIRSEQRPKLEAISAIAKDLYPIADSGDNWDSDPWLFCVKNGVIDLRDGTLRDGKPEDRITQQSPVTYDPVATATRWVQFLDEIFCGDTELIAWLKKFFGYCLTGDTKEQIVIIGYGKGANGKGRLLATLRHILGAYAYDAPFSTFELNQRAAIPNDLAALVSRRFVTSSETNEGTRLNESRIKSLSGQDPVTARFLHCEFFTFQPVAKFCLAVNHRPKVSDDSYGFWRRVRLIPFNRQFTGQSDDKNLLEKLLTESSGILNWLIEGCLEWQKQGLDQIPQCISTATSEYQADSDPLSQFILDSCIINPQCQVRGKDLYAKYLAWCSDQGLREREILTNTGFGRKIGEKFKKSHKMSGTIYFGLALDNDGLMTGLGTTPTENEVNPILNPSRKDLIEKPVITCHRHENPSLENTEYQIKICPNCKREIEFIDNLCTGCGQKLTESEEDNGNSN